MLIEQDPDLVARLRSTLDVQWFIADACEVSSLHEAGLETVDVVVAATGDDEDNLVISLLAKQEFAVPRVVARVNHPHNQWLFKNLTTPVSKLDSERLRKFCENRPGTVSIVDLP